MPESDFQTPTDIDALRRENELLALEVRFLKARLSGSGPSASELEERLAESERIIAHLRQQLANKERNWLPPPRRAQLESAERDLSALLKRLSGSPLGYVFRLNKTYRALEQRHLKP